MIRDNVSQRRSMSSGKVADPIELSADTGRFMLDSTEFFQQFKAFDPMEQDEFIFPLENLIKVEELVPTQHMDMMELFERMYGPCQSEV